jgi:predicted secreted protein
VKRIAVQVASARRAASLVAVLGAMTLPALAGDRALLDVIGFSPDASYFAFEEYGEQDGSGFAYANIYVVDVARDSWLPGTPVRVRADDEATPLADIRAEADGKAQPFLEETNVSTPAEIVALIGDGAVGPDATVLSFGRPGYAAGEVSDRRDLQLTTFPATSVEDCSTYFGTEPLGYRLTLSDGSAAITLHEDTGPLPRSRGCPLDYRLHAVVLPWQSVVQERGVVIVSVYPGGFEGPDRRFLAVPFAF